MGENRNSAHGASLRKRQKPFCVLAILFFGTVSARATGNDPPSVQAVVRASASITLDGRLDEPVWRDAPVLKLTQQSPKPGAQTPYETEVRIVVTKDRLYFGFICKDPDPGRI